MHAPRIAWFSPLPPSTSGIAAYSAELIAGLQARGWTIEAFPERDARDFVWKHRRQPFDLTVYQLGNADCHDYMWGYLFRYPGMVVLHDGQLHQARALHLTRRWLPRRDDYLAEFRANHPDAPPDVGLLVAAGLGGTLYHHWPLLRLVVESARLTLVHNRWLAASLRESFPSAPIAAIEMGVADAQPADGDRSLARGGTAQTAHAPGGQPPTAAAVAEVRARHGIPPDAVVLAAYGGLTPEKRLPALLRAVGAIADRHHAVRVMLVGAAAAHYDPWADAARWGVADRVHVTGFVPDEELPAYLAAADVAACLRWPTNRETSASWLRCLSAGRATLVTDLAHMAHVPTLDPRGWRVLDVEAPAGPDQDLASAARRAPRDPVAVSIDIRDEDHTLQLALERVAADAALRQRLGDAGRRWWHAHHRLEQMAQAYEPHLHESSRTPPPRLALPRHLRDDASGTLRALAASLGVDARLPDLIGGVPL